MNSDPAPAAYGADSATGARDGLVDELIGLADVSIEVLQRAMVSVAVVHQLDARGRCHTCSPWWRLRGLPYP